MFTRSKMAVVDELKRRQRTVSAQFVDFLEVLGRIADYIALPTRKDLDDWLEEAKLEPGPNPYWTYNRTLSSGVRGPTPRYTKENIACDVAGGTSRADCS